MFAFALILVAFRVSLAMDANTFDFVSHINCKIYNVHCIVEVLATLLIYLSLAPNHEANIMLFQHHRRDSLTVTRVEFRESEMKSNCQSKESNWKRRKFLISFFFLSQETYEAKSNGCDGWHKHANQCNCTPRHKSV